MENIHVQDQSMCVLFIQYIWHRAYEEIRRASLPPKHRVEVYQLYGEYCSSSFWAPGSRRSQ